MEDTKKHYKTLPKNIASVKQNRKDWMLHLLLVVVSFDLLTLWLPLVRAVADGSNYSWSSFGLTGTGVNGPYFGILALATIALIILYLGWRKHSKLFRWLILMWLVPSALPATVAALSGELRFEGETLNIGFTVPMPVTLMMYVIPALLALYWSIPNRKLEDKPKPKWNTTNKLLLFGALILIPPQVVLLRYGAPGSIADIAGVILTIMQWAALVASIAPWTSRNT